MMNPFPILFLAPVALLVLRVFLGLFLAYCAVQHFNARNELARVFTLSWFPFGRVIAYLFPLVEILLAGCTLLGFYTQYAMIVLMLMSLKLFLLRPWFAHPSIPSRATYYLLFAAALTLFISGAGAFAFDLPI